MQVSSDGIHRFLKCPRRYLIAKVVGILKSDSVSQIFESILRSGKTFAVAKVWTNGVFVRIVGDQATVKKNIQHRWKEEHKRTH